MADLGELDMNESLHVSALKLPEGCKPVVTDRDIHDRGDRAAGRRRSKSPAVPVAAAAAPAAAAPAAKGGAKKK